MAHFYCLSTDNTENTYEEQVEYGSVVFVLDLRPVDAAALQLLLVLREQMLVKEVLESLVSDVNEQLLEAVLLEVLEARHVEDPDRTSPAVDEQNVLNNNV